MSGKSFKFFDPLITKWRPFKILAKLNESDILTANIFKINEHQTFGSIEMHNASNIYFSNK